MAICAPSTGAPLCAPVDIASVPETVPFDPAGWLTRFVAAGGGYAVSGHRLSLCISFDHTTPDQQNEARAMIGDMTDDRLASLRAHLRSTEAGGA